MRTPYAGLKKDALAAATLGRRRKPGISRHTGVARVRLLERYATIALEKRAQLCCVLTYASLPAGSILKLPAAVSADYGQAALAVSPRMSLQLEVFSSDQPQYLGRRWPSEKATSSKFLSYVNVSAYQVHRPYPAASYFVTLPASLISIIGADAIEPMACRDKYRKQQIFRSRLWHSGQQRQWSTVLLAYLEVRCLTQASMVENGAL